MGRINISTRRVLASTTEQDEFFRILGLLCHFGVPEGSSAYVFFFLTLSRGQTLDRPRTVFGQCKMENLRYRLSHKLCAASLEVVAQRQQEEWAEESIPEAWTRCLSRYRDPGYVLSPHWLTSLSALSPLAGESGGFVSDTKFFRRAARRSSR